MNPFYQDELTTLYHGDCRTILPLIQRTPVVMTDPVWPNAPRGKGELKGAADPFGLFSTALHSLSWLPKRLVVVLRGDSDPRFLSAVPRALPFFRSQFLSYAIPGYIGRKLGGDEIAYGFGSPITSVPGKRLIPGWSPKAQPFQRAANGHPCSRALVHFEWLINWWVEPGESILDMFAGSGTTLAAAKIMGVQSIGIEIERKYCRLIAERLSAIPVPGKIATNG